MNALKHHGHVIKCSYKNHSIGGVSRLSGDFWRTWTWDRFICSNLTRVLMDLSTFCLSLPSRTFGFRDSTWNFMILTETQGPFLFVLDISRIWPIWPDHKALTFLASQAAGLVIHDHTSHGKTSQVWWGPQMGWLATFQAWLVVINKSRTHHHHHHHRHSSLPYYLKIYHHNKQPFRVRKIVLTLERHDSTHPSLLLWDNPRASVQMISTHDASSNRETS